MTLTRVRLENFTAFDNLDLRPSPGINVLVGANGTGKTHLMKVCYAACDVSKKPEVSFATKLLSVFLPYRREPGRLVRRTGDKSRASLAVWQDDCSIKTSFSRRAKSAGAIEVSGTQSWAKRSIESVYIPVKEMLSNAPGFRSLYSNREIHFDEVYADILDRAYLPPLRGSLDVSRHNIVEILQRDLQGTVIVKNEEFFLQNGRVELEFTLLAEGLRKLALLSVLILNGSLPTGSVLFWDEPETNLNPKLFGTVMNILLELQRNGVQIFLATHDYVILEELDIRKGEQDEVAFHSLYRDGETGEISCNTANNYLGIHPNAIAEAYDDLYDQKIKSSLSQAGL